MNVLVTGGAGYIGSHAVKALLASDHHVAVIDNLSKGHRKAVSPEASFYQVDLHETNRLEEILRANKIEVVMHFAAFIAVGESVSEPVMYYRNNTGGALSLLTAMSACGVKRFIFSSTAATYGQPERVPIEEDDRQRPINPYGWSKWMVERILRDLSTSDPDFAFTALRYFNVAGAAQDGSIGEDHHPETHLIPKVLDVPLGHEQFVPVFGHDYQTADGTCVRDYVHVEDLISAHILAMNALTPGRHKFYNLGIGRGYSVREIVEAAREVTGHPIPIQYGPRREGDPDSLFACSNKIQQELHWKPRFTDVHEVIETAWNWHRNHPNGYGE
ncbi:MAG: UDP-glucose 4-epimerase GalE [Thermoguttaceae bacterium]|nr:UDP-glucose 4-epimerase GalE [Thermoguttaceae bacterium]